MPGKVGNHTRLLICSLALVVIAMRTWVDVLPKVVRANSDQSSADQFLNLV